MYIYGRRPASWNLIGEKINRETARNGVGGGASLRPSAPCSWFGCPTLVPGVPDPGFECPDVLGCPFFGVLGEVLPAAPQVLQAAGAAKCGAAAGRGCVGWSCGASQRTGRRGGHCPPSGAVAPSPTSQPCTLCGAIPHPAEASAAWPPPVSPSPSPRALRGHFPLHMGGTHGGTHSGDPELLPGVPSLSPLFSRSLRSSAGAGWGAGGDGGARPIRDADSGARKCLPVSSRRQPPPPSIPAQPPPPPHSLRSPLLILTSPPVRPCLQRGLGEVVGGHQVSAPRPSSARRCQGWGRIPCREKGGGGGVFQPPKNK